MENILDGLADQIKTAMKAKQKERLDALRYLKSMLMENKTAAKPRPEIDVIISYHKKLKDSLVHYTDSPAQSLKLQNEIAVIESFLPKPLEEAEVKILIDKIKLDLNTTQFGQIMKELTPLIKGKFDGKKATDLVKNALK